MKILIVQLGCIGDMVLQTPVFKALRAHYPQAQIDVLASKSNSRVISSNPNINNIHIFNKQPINLFRLIMSIRKNKYDWYLDAKDHDSNESRWLAKLSKAKNKVGFSSDESVFNFSVSPNTNNLNLHAVDRDFNTLKHMGIKVDELSKKPELFPTPQEKKNIDTFLSINNIAQFIVLNLSAGTQSRIPSQELWERFFTKIDTKGISIVVTNMPNESHTASMLCSSFDNVNNYTSTNIMEVAELVSRSRILVSPDTSLIHIASAFNTPTLAMFANFPYNNNKFAPLADIADVVITPGKDDSLNLIDVDELCLKFNKMLRRLIDG